ncbi:hypothetical protein SAMN04487949_2662 [Halogranum gelatinilyticum]|jgi:hypothetical protein|uniref:Uncharacterized protein n=1 Tax=Halogranum gelatinilyticum TaxID=660521 RepID=A0A1G9W9N6_9EURY|nr:hypothetical protein [Halogranum gelatinilyticum]SDM80941.1 hypothetical protein SAMN04487949_2662 [Halogranum gelatinilyticum]
MFRAHFPDGDIECERYELTEYGVDLYNDEDELLAFVPYSNLIALMNEEVERDPEPSIAD